MASRPLRESPPDPALAGRGCLRGSPAFRMRDVLAGRRHDGVPDRRRERTSMMAMLEGQGPQRTLIYFVQPDGRGQLAISW
jgi:hypothetical protein